MEAIFTGYKRPCNRRFLPMCSHYPAKPFACTRASGWEKGLVENQVGLVRERFFTPRLRVKSLIQFALHLIHESVALREDSTAPAR